MENRMRDLEQIQERDPSDSGQRLSAVLMATLAVVGLTFAIGVLVGQAAEPEAEVADPLALLEKAGAVPAQAAAPTADVPVKASDLSFAQALSDEEERPEVVAALEAAAIEARNLQDPALPLEAIGSGSAAAPAPAPAEPPPSDDQIAAALPAAVAAGSVGQKLPAAARRDPMIASAIADASDLAPAAAGEAGEYTLQVISYEEPAAARSFADGLRARGHKAFVTLADIPERGRYYRVRIGPFETRPKAEAYRREFEQSEGMNTFVVRRPRDEDQG